MFNGQRQPICLDSAADRNSMSKPVGLWPCHNMGGNQASYMPDLYSRILYLSMYVCVRACVL